MGNRWIWTGIDYHPCITSEPTNQMCWDIAKLLPNISRNKGNQTMKFDQLIEYIMTNIILEKSYTKCGGETSLRSFSGKLKLSKSLNQ